MKYFNLTLVLFAFLCVSQTASAQSIPTGYSITNIASGWVNPVGATFNTNGTQMFVWEKGGKVWLCNWNNTTSKYEKQSTAVLDISQEVGDWRDFGLLGFALDPNFETTGMIYLLYVVDRHHLINFGTGSYNPGTNEYFNATIGRITRYHVTTNASNIVTADPASRFILLGESKTTGIPILHQSHGTGSLAFAADGTLIASTGDGASYSSNDLGSASETYFTQGLIDGIIRPQENVGAYRAQMINCLNGKILRIDPVTGDGVPSNPFYSASEPRAPKSRVWALGFRNPCRFTIKPNSGSTNPATGDLGEIYVGDVGYNTYEELDIVEEKGANFGWPLYEGQTAVSGYTTPNVANLDEPNPLYGTGACTQQFFLFKQLLKQATADDIKTVFNPCDAATPITGGYTNRFFHHRPALDWRHGTNSSRIGIFNGNNATTAELGTPASGVVGSPFPGNCSIGGTWYTGTTFPPEFRNSYLFADYGTNFIKRATMQTSTQLQRIDNFVTGFNAIVFLRENPRDGSLLTVDIANGNPVKLISYGGSQPPVVVMSANQYFGASDLAVNFTGAGSFDPEGAALSYAWDFGDGHTSTDVNPANTFTGTPGVSKKYMVKLTVKDNMNLSTTDSFVVSVNNTPPVVNITSPVKDSKYTVGSDTTYTLQASVTDAEHSNGLLKYQWQTILRHNNHQHAEEIDTARLSTTNISRIGCNGDTYYWMVKLTVTDADGLSTVDSSKIFPSCSSEVGLPIRLTSFTVQTQASVNMVKWRSELELNSRYYQLERSSDGIHFKLIREEPSRNSSLPQSYSYADDKYVIGANFYRLKMVDLDGSFTYSAIVKTYNGAKTDYSLKVIPNPVQKEFTLSTSFPEKGSVQIRISDMTGKLVKQLTENVSKGYQTLEIYQLESLAPGTYYIEVKQKEYSRNTRFVKVE